MTETAPTCEVVVFNGVKFRRYPHSKNRSDRVYFTPGQADRARGVGRLHEELWKAEHGEIPDGHHVHHADHDPLNNDLANLVCVPAGDHHRHHAEHTDYHTPDRLAHLESIRPLAADWHRSEEGRAWHSEHGRRTWEGRQARALVCEQCGKEFQTRDKSKTPRFCSNSCKAAWRRESGLDDEDRACPACGATFRVNRYSKTRACSRSCGSALRTDRGPG